VHSFFELGLTPVISDVRSAAAIAREAVRRGVTLPVHVKIDTGMGRMGIAAAATSGEIPDIAAMEGIEIAGLMSHFSEADLADRSYAREQIALFGKIREMVTAWIGRPVVCHMANSAAILALGDGLFDAVRPGILLYGVSPVEDDMGLMPVMSVSAPILAVRRVGPGQPISYGRTFLTRRESLIGVLPVGYADGYSRLFSNRAEVLVRGRRAPVVGRVCMDLTMVDLTETGDVEEGDEAVLLGRQGRECITARELAGIMGTIPYELLTLLGGRSRKEYVSA
jgi:alanine racemase